MLDKRCFALLDAINNECNDSGYQIFSLTELIDLLPKRLGIEEEGLKEAITSLVNNEYISVKYQDDFEVCLRPLIKGRLAIENVATKKQSDKDFKNRVAFLAMLGGFFGGFFWSLLLYIITLLGGAYAF